MEIGACTADCPEVGIHIHNGLIRTDFSDETCHGIDLSLTALGTLASGILSSVVKAGKDSYGSAALDSMSPASQSDYTDLRIESGILKAKTGNWF